MSHPISLDFDGMNSVERRYADEFLLPGLLAKEISHYTFESTKIRIGHRCWYTPDFEVVADGVTSYHEVKTTWRASKGKPARIGMREDARVKLHAAAALRPWNPFYLCVRTLEGSWEITRIPA